MGIDRIATRRAPALFPAMLLVLACGAPTSATPAAPAPTFALATAAPETYPTESPPVTIPPGFVLPVPSPLTAGNADIHAQRALFLRTGSVCFTHMDVDGGYSGDFDGMAAKLETDEGLLEDRRSYVGPLVEALRALDLEPIGVEAGDVAYGIGRVIHRRASPQLPPGTVWTPRLQRFELDDGRTGWTLSGDWIAVVDRDCGVLPTTPG